VNGLNPEEISSLQDTFKSEYEREMGENMAPAKARRLANLTKQFYLIGKASWIQQKLLKEEQSLEKVEKIAELQRLIDSVVVSLKTSDVLS
jgi:hypothetical protein